MSLSSPPEFHLPLYKQNYSENDVVAYWYDEEFSQSRYPPGQKVSTACTLICLLVAQRISETELLVYNVEECPKITVIIAESIVEGNNIHEWIVKKGLVSHPYLNTEEALKLGGRSLCLLREWTFKVFRENIEKGLYQHVTFFDSHSHNTITKSNRGLVIAQATMDNLKLLCDWYNEDILNKCYNTKATEYELAFLYSDGSPSFDCEPLCQCGAQCRIHNN
ncbi:uncharacterized protein LOC143377646 isoform X2 [Andrena cerasifolii]|uniref:uncharacterized protein LOC143377646 isoform X2 n=1 Tax=Andrena cerasifolii TaxID=2819439 RepID=UPI00403775BF